MRLITTITLMLPMLQKPSVIRLCQIQKRNQIDYAYEPLNTEFEPSFERSEAVKLPSDRLNAIVV